MKHEEGDPCKDANYLEPDIDSVRALKDQVRSLCYKGQILKCLHFRSWSGIEKKVSAGPED